MKIAALVAALAIASPLAAFAQAPGATRTIVTHEETRSGPVVTRTTTTHRIARHHRHMHRHHHMVRKLVTHSRGPAGATTTTTIVKR
jgi:hypothetical protein